MQLTQATIQKNSYTDYQFEVKHPQSLITIK